MKKLSWLKVGQHQFQKNVTHRLTLVLVDGRDNQDYGIIDDETVSFNVSLKKFGNNQGQIKEVLEIVGLQGREKDKALVLSGGEKQRLGIARAILKNASVIFADEPTASLDNSNRQIVVSLLKDCANRGAAIILATHDERLVAECDTVVRLGT